jgi:hypothetical protein
MVIRRHGLVDPEKMRHSSSLQAGMLLADIPSLKLPRVENPIQSLGDAVRIPI